MHGIMGTANLMGSSSVLMSILVSTCLAAGHSFPTHDHVVFTKQGTSAKVFVNGELLITSTVPATISYFNPRRLLIGADDDALEDGIADIWFFKGKLDDIRIYNRPLTNLEIQKLANDK
ncbi:LamG domain-containing protein [Arsenicibacter rosenii]|uniref:LamG domain-containing protein n=1 Tax=Arsenicibacter rosenii TaxID=1750698 RepID=UPI00286E0954|nr:LamG domain-containing protein [Arsenicibacter rosenii]